MNTHYKTTIRGKITVKELADCIETLMAMPEEVDMAIVEAAVNQVLQYNKATFRDYYDLLHEQMLDERDGLLNRFTEIGEYFFDVINSKKLSRARLEHLIEETVIF